MKFTGEVVTKVLMSSLFIKISGTFKQMTHYYDLESFEPMMKCYALEIEMLNQ